MRVMRPLLFAAVTTVGFTALAPVGSAQTTPSQPAASGGAETSAMTVTKVAEIADLDARTLWSDGTSLFIIGSAASGDNRLVRVDPATGAVSAEATVESGESLGEFFEIGDSTFVSVSSYQGADPTCSLRKLDPATTALGEPMVMTSASTCGRLILDSTRPGVIWGGFIIGLDATESAFAVQLDTATGTATSTDFTAAIQPSESVAQFMVAGGVPLATTAARYGTDGKPMTAADGSELPSRILKIVPGGETQAITVKGTAYQALDGTVYVQDFDTGDEVLDPVAFTLAPAPNGGPGNLQSAATLNGKGYDTFESNGELTVEQQDPETFEVFTKVKVPTGTDEGSFGLSKITLVGEKLLVTVGSRNFEKSTASTVLFVVGGI